MSSTFYGNNVFVNLLDLSPHSTPTLSHSSSDSVPSSPNEEPHELPPPAISIPIPSTRTRRTSRAAKMTRAQGSPAIAEGSSHKGRHLRRGEQLKRNAACQQCRQRRTKCDGTRPQCASCIRHHAYLQKTQPAAYPADSCVACSYDDDADQPALPLDTVAKRGVGSDDMGGTVSAPNGRRRSMPIMPRSRPIRKSSKQSSTTPSDVSPREEVHEGTVNDLYNRVAQLQSELLQQQLASSSASTSTSTPLFQPRLPFSDDGLPDTMLPQAASSSTYSPTTSTSHWGIEELDPVVGYITGLTHVDPQLPMSASSMSSFPSSSTSDLPFDANYSFPQHPGAPGGNNLGTSFDWYQQMISPNNTAGPISPQAAFLATAHGFGFAGEQSVLQSLNNSFGTNNMDEPFFPNSENMYRQAVESMQSHSLQEVLSMNQAMYQQNIGTGAVQESDMAQMGLALMGTQLSPQMAIGQTIPRAVQDAPVQQQQQPPGSMMDWWATAYLEQEIRERTDAEGPRHSI